MIWHCFLSLQFKADYSCILADVDYANCSSASDLATTLKKTLKDGSQICFTTGNAAASFTIQWGSDELITINKITHVGGNNIPEIRANFKFLLVSVVVVRTITFPILFI